MNFKFLLKSITLALSISFVSSESIEIKGDCKDLRDFFSERNATSSLTKCEVDSNGKVTTLGLDSYMITEECVKKALSYNTITNLNYLKGDATISHVPTYTGFPPEIANLTNLEEFSFSFSGYRIYAKTSIGTGKLRLSKSLKKLDIAGIIATQGNIDDIATLTNLEHLELHYFNRPSEAFDFAPLKNLKKISYLDLFNEAYFELNDLPEVAYASAGNLKHLTVRGHGIKQLSDKFSTLKNIKYLDLAGNNIESLLGKLKSFKNLEHLDLARNDIKEEIPKFLNDFKNLNYINLSGNKDISGKTLTNSKLESCIYDKEYKNLCIAKKDMKCLEKDNYSLPTCDGDSEDYVDPSGRCGKGIGRCREGNCCSKYGWCGSSEAHCSVSNGCQSEFGICNSSPTDGNQNPDDDTNNDLPYTENGQCNSKDGRCRPGQCCSKYGWCGTGDIYCGAGCQKEFGGCN